MTTKKKSKTSPESIVREIKRRTRRKFTAEEKIRMVLEGLRVKTGLARFMFQKPSSTACWTSIFKCYFYPENI